MFSQPNNQTAFFTRIFFDLFVCIHRRPFLLWAANAARKKTICLGYFPTREAEAESKEKHGVWDPMPLLTITSPHLQSIPDYSTFTAYGQPYARVDFVLQSGT